MFESTTTTTRGILLYGYKGYVESMNGWMGVKEGVKECGCVSVYV